MLISRGRIGKEDISLTGTTPHALCWHAERGDVAEAPMESLTQTFNVWKSACVCFSTLKLKEIFPVCHVKPLALGQL